MEYRYPPLYKYAVLFLILFLFLRYYRQITPDKYLLIAILVTLLVATLDYMFVYEHPSLISTSEEEFNADDLDDILDDKKDGKKDEADDIKETRLPINSQPPSRMSSRS